MRPATWCVAGRSRSRQPDGLLPQHRLPWMGSHRTPWQSIWRRISNRVGPSRSPEHHAAGNTEPFDRDHAPLAWRDNVHGFPDLGIPRRRALDRPGRQASWSGSLQSPAERREV
ncbi:MAG: hypothetical protein ER33_02820 [Cyanobium sp. CACIAM 14]|nr:MAG: hypothetical protein ER33_02820 [Cyanobium sp. CACIAM 14]